MNRKGMTEAITLVVAVVVFLVIALLLITLLSKNVGLFSSSSGTSITQTSSSLQCQTELAADCVSKDSDDICTDCPSCPGAICP